MTGEYDDIIHLSRPILATRKPMAMIDRAAQFSSFAALVGYEEALEETERQTEQRAELDDNERYMLDMKQRYLLEHLSETPEVAVTYFLPDERKSGGSYITITGNLKKICPNAAVMILADGTRISLADIIGLDSSLLSNQIE